MPERNLGPSGLRVSVVGLGCNNFGGRIDAAATRKVVDKAIDLGITLFDTADIYGNQGGSEELLGQTLGERRKEIVLASKFGLPMDKAGRLQGGSRRYIMSAVEASLKRLKTDWLDLYQYHRPDPLTPMDETLRALDDLVRQGKVRYIGSSNFSGWQTADAEWIARSQNLHRYVCCQNEYSLLVRGIEQDLVPAMQAYGLSLLPYFPLASGLLTGKYKRGEALPAGTRLAGANYPAERVLTEANWTKVEALRKFCEARGRTMLELAFSWLAMKPFVASVIAGATTPAQLEQNVRAVEWTLSADELAEIDRITA
ncbi:MAG: aldo/keto reductase [Pseudorhodoplanes sp.]